MFVGVVRPNSLGKLRLQVVHLWSTPLLDCEAQFDRLLFFWHLLHRMLRLPTR